MYSIAWLNPKAIKAFSGSAQKSAVEIISVPAAAESRARFWNLCARQSYHNHSPSPPRAIRALGTISQLRYSSMNLMIGDVYWEIT